LRTSPYHPQCDGLTERFNRTLQKMIAAYVNEAQSDWDLRLGALAFAYNTAVQASTKCTPFELVYGRLPKIPLDLVIPDSSVDLHLSPQTYALFIKGDLELAYAQVSQVVELKSIKTKIRYDRVTRAASYKVGDKVRMLELAKSKGKSKKLTRKWKGPFEVMEVISEQNLRIKACSKNGKSLIVHKNLLKRSYDRSKLPEESPKYHSRADQTLKKAPNPSKFRYRVITATGLADATLTAPNKNK
jgi:hypothetical protein